MENNNSHINSVNVISDPTKASAFKVADSTDLFATEDPFQSSATTGTFNSRNDAGAYNLSQTDPFGDFMDQRAKVIDSSNQTNTINRQGDFTATESQQSFTATPQPFESNFSVNCASPNVFTSHRADNYDKIAVLKTPTENPNKDKDISGIDQSCRTSPFNNFDAFQAPTASSSENHSNVFNKMNSGNMTTTSAQNLRHFSELKISNSNQSDTGIFGLGNYNTLSPTVETPSQESISSDVFAALSESNISTSDNAPSKIFHSQSDYDLVPGRNQKSEDAKIDIQFANPMAQIQNMSTEEKEIEMLRLMNKPPPPKPPRRNIVNFKGSESVAANQNKVSRAPQYPAPVLQQPNLGASKASQVSNIPSKNRSWSTVCFIYLLLICLS